MLPSIPEILGSNYFHLDINYFLLASQNLDSTGKFSCTIKSKRLSAQNTPSVHDYLECNGFKQFFPWSALTLQRLCNKQGNQQYHTCVFSSLENKPLFSRWLNSFFSKKEGVFSSYNKLVASEWTLQRLYKRGIKLKEVRVLLFHRRN